MRTTSRILSALAILAALCPGLTADDPLRSSGPFRSLEELNSSYQSQSRELDRRHAADLAAFAAKSKGTEADAAYSQLFHLAIRRGLCLDAKLAADRCLASPASPRELRALATLVRINASADRGDEDTALADLKVFLKSQGRGESATETEAALAVAEAFLQRQIGAGRYGAARALCEFACEMQGAPDAFKSHFKARMSRMNLLGKAAPPISGPDADGHNVSLAGLKGKVVLVDFWATWCPPCVAAVPQRNALAEKYRGQDFAILGVNVDAMHQDVKDVKTALPVVRRFLVEHGVHWANLLNAAGKGDAVTGYGVEEIPASFLIARDGRVIAFDLAGDELDRAITRSLAVKAPGALP